MGVPKITKKIYICGATGIDNQNGSLFGKAETYLEKIGFLTCNPFKIYCENPHKTILQTRVGVMCDCDALYVLNNWRDCKDAIIEHTVAMQLGLTIYYEEYSLFKNIRADLLDYRKSEKEAHKAYISKWQYLLKNAFIEMNLPYSHVSEKIGVSKQTVSSWANVEKVIPLHHAKKVARILNYQLPKTNEND